MPNAKRTTVHLAQRDAPFGAACGKHHGTFVSAASAVTCRQCLAAMKDDPTLTAKGGPPSALVTLTPPVKDVNAKVRRQLDDELARERP